jgi:hypothetical protein
VLATPAIMSVMREDAARFGELRAEQDGDLPSEGRGKDTEAPSLGG